MSILSEVGQAVPIRTAAATLSEEGYLVIARGKALEDGTRVFPTSSTLIEAVNLLDYVRHTTPKNFLILVEFVAVTEERVRKIVPGVFKSIAAFLEHLMHPAEATADSQGDALEPGTPQEEVLIP